MTGALDLLGPHLRLLPDGETGVRRNWILNVMRELERHPDLAEGRAGDWSDYDHLSRLKVRPGHRLDGRTLDLGYVAAFEEGFGVLEKLAAARGRDDLVFQVGMPGDLDFTLFALGPAAVLRYRKAIRTALLQEIEAIHARAGSKVVFELELPVELVLLTQLPKVLRPAIAAFLARGVAAMVAQAPTGARFGVHLCLGDLRNKARGKLTDAGPLVTLTNALAKAWPKDRQLEFVHVPLAAGDVPAPSLGPFYEPLGKLRLPAEVRFIAGFVHEKRTVTELGVTLHAIESAAGRQVDLATACGLGRRTPEAAAETMTKAALLTNT